MPGMKLVKSNVALYVPAFWQSLWERCQLTAEHVVHRKYNIAAGDDLILEILLTKLGIGIREYRIDNRNQKRIRRAGCRSRW